MNVTIIKQKAKELGVKTAKKDTTELIKSIQQAEGNSPCFKSGSASCGQQNCLWRIDCLSST
jgi:hypothetical protein